MVKKRNQDIYKMKLPKKYLTKDAAAMKSEIKKHGKKADNDSSAYGPWIADYKGRNTKGEKYETKKSKYTKKYEKMYGDKKNESIISSWEDFVTETKSLEKEMKDEGLFEQTEIFEAKMKSSVEKSLRKKAEKTGFPYGILKQIWNRGYSAWKVGHVAGTNPEQWAHARVNSFIVGGRTTEVGDKALYQKAKKARAKKKKK
jgi:hypothetical protein